MSWKLQAGEMTASYLTETEIWQSIHQFFYQGKNSATYKFGFFKSLLECSLTANEDGEIPFNTIFYSFTKIYWNLVMQHDLWQTNNLTRISSVQKVIQQFALSQQIPPGWSFEKLLDSQKLELIEKVKRVGKINVIGATYGDFNGRIYSFDLKREYFRMHPQFITTLQTYRRILTNVTNYQLALFLEKFNPTEKVQHLLSKVEFVTTRQSLKDFLHILQKAGIDTCFYCQKALKKSPHVDHFIPWSYFQNDLLWNFVLACPTCNTSKNNKLAAPVYLDDLITRNDQLLKQSFLDVQFSHYTSKKLIHLYDYAQANGISANWTPKKLS